MRNVEISEARLRTSDCMSRGCLVGLLTEVDINPDGAIY